MVSLMTSSQSLFNTVLNFINDFKGKYPAEIEDVFSNGYCYWFAEILHQRFNGIIYYLPIKNHFITKINGKYFDITGEVIPDEKVYEWEYYANFDYLDYNRVVKNCILKCDF